MNKKTIKTVIIILILFLTGIGAIFGINTARTYLSGAAAGEEPKNVRVQADAASATITWQSDKETVGVVEYGTNQASLLLRALETQKSTIHRVVLSPLKTATTYYFRVRIGETIYDNNGIPYSFATKPATAKVEEKPTAQPTVPSRSITSSPVSPTPSLTVRVTSCVVAEFEAKMGTTDSRYDFNGNGRVDSRDYLLCLEKNK